MFYSTEVLTSRKYGVATVWLVSTLGSKSSLKKVNRKQILGVDVAKACDTILTPDVPMALRLQSNLLYGVTRVYSQQCGYVLSDAEAARNSMRAMMRMVQQADLEPEGNHKANADQLMLQDDPNFLLDQNLNFEELDNLDINVNLNDDTQMSLSPHAPRSGSITGSQQDIGGLNIPPSNSSFSAGGADRLSLFDGHEGSVAGPRQRPAPRQLDEGDDLDLDLGFDPALIGGPVSDHRTPVNVDGAGQAGGSDDDDQLQQQDEHMMIDDGFIGPQDDIAPAGELENGTATAAEASAHGSQVVSSESATATTHNKRRKLKRIAFDRETAYHNSDIAAWVRDYPQNMREQGMHKYSAKMKEVAKKNAEYWMLHAGSILGQGMRGPLDIFSGARLLEAFTGINLLEPNKKRRREPEEGDENQSKRSRAGPSSDQQDGGPFQFNDDNVFMGDESVEQGREQPTPLDERHASSVFPWNQSAGSRQPTDHQPTSASFGGGPQLNIFGRRGSRLTSASPLARRGIAETHNIDDFQLGRSDYNMNDAEQEFELYGAAAQVETQTAAQSQWQTSAFAGESANFLDFVQNAIIENGDQHGSIDFATLLPDEDNSQIVAAQALMHVLTLGTSNALKVEQEESFGPIMIRVA